MNGWMDGSPVGGNCPPPSPHLRLPLLYFRSPPLFFLRPPPPSCARGGASPSVDTGGDKYRTRTPEIIPYNMRNIQIVFVSSQAPITEREIHRAAAGRNRKDGEKDIDRVGRETGGNDGLGAVLSSSTEYHQRHELRLG